MTTIELPSGARLKLYATIKEMPVSLFNLMQGYLLQDSGIGSTMEDVDKHFQQLDALLSAGKLEEAVTERENLHYNLYAMFEGISFQSLAFGCFIYSIDKEVIDDYSEDNIKLLLDDLSAKGLTIGMVEEQLEQLKKN